MHRTQIAAPADAGTLLDLSADLYRLYLYCLLRPTVSRSAIQRQARHVRRAARIDTQTALFGVPAIAPGDVAAEAVFQILIELEAVILS